MGRKIIEKDVQRVHQLLRVQRGTNSGKVELGAMETISHGNGRTQETTNGIVESLSTDQQEQLVFVCRLSTREKRKWAGHFSSVYKTADQYWKHLKKMGNIYRKVRRRRACQQIPLRIALLSFLNRRTAKLWQQGAKGARK